MQKIIEKLEAFLEWGGTKKDILLLGIAAASLICSLAGIRPFFFDMAWISIIVCGIPIILEACIGLITAFDIKADVLVSLALIASVCIGEDFAAGEVAFIMQLGALLEDLTVAKAREGIEKLIKLTPQTARVLENDTERIIPATEVTVGMKIRVLPGETVPVDGVILSGSTSINQAVMTGESLPVDKTAGDEVSSGTVNQFGAFDMEAVKVGEDSSIQRMIRLVQSADAGKAKIVGLADRWATWIVVIALTAAALTWFFTGAIIRAVTILVVFCPCALVLATPTAIMAAIGNATKHGFLIREGDALERLANCKNITFDKTGTLTYGTPKVVRVFSKEGYSQEELLCLVAAAEQFSEHPLGVAVCKGYKTALQENKQAQPLPEAKNFTMLPGLGVSAVVLEKEIFAGNETLLKEKTAIDKAADIEALLRAAVLDKAKGHAVIYAVADGAPLGFITLADTLREGSAAMIRKLQDLQIKTILLTGDHENAANTISDALGIDEVYGACLPENKLEIIAAYQQKKEAVCMIGDGINDAPALKKANVGIAMGGVGSDIAVDAADMALVEDQVEELPHLFALSKRMMTTIKLNLTFSMTLNFLAIVLAITGILNPVVGALVHNCGSVLVITNSALLLRWKMRN